nr:1-aminocyclopropane-1-carboxylate oxidase 5-like [Tanacetum cinerariifolium]
MSMAKNLYKHCLNADNLSNDDEYMDLLSYDVIWMLLIGSEHKHALCFHVCDGSSEFHVYSKKGWVSFSTDKHALVVTIGDQRQTWSEGKYKHVIGRPIFKGELEDCISMDFLYSPNLPISKGQKDNTISLGVDYDVSVALETSITKTNSNSNTNPKQLPTKNKKEYEISDGLAGAKGARTDNAGFGIVWRYKATP